MELFVAKQAKKMRHTTSRAPTAVDQMVGEKIRRLRQDRNMTLAELGNELGISHQQLQKYETGTNRLSAGMLSSVADVLRVPIASLFEDENANKGKNTDPSAKARAECHSWIDRTASPERLGMMARVLRALSND